MLTDHSSKASVHPSPPTAPHASLRRPVLLVANYAGAVRPRYSVVKFKELVAYCAATSPLRVALVLLLTPFPGLIVAVLPALLPLQPPQLGYNVAFFCHAAIVDFSCAFGIIMIWCSVTEVPQTVYSRQEAAVVCVINTAIHTSLLFVTALYWRFPIPFSWVLFATVFLGTLAISHLVVLRQKLWRCPQLPYALRAYSASMLFQSSQIFFYPAFSVLFDNVSNSWRIVLTLLFPLLKYTMKKMLQRLSHHLRDHNAEVAVCGVEICAALYQSTILQASPASIGIPFIIGLDVLQAMVVIKLLFDRHAKFSRPHDLLMDTASALVNRFNIKSEPDLTRLTCAPRGPPTPVSGPQLETAGPHLTNAFVLREPRLASTQSHESLVQNALEMAFHAEQVVLIEYIEVFVPLLNSLFVLLTLRLPSARFNPRLLPFYINDDSFLWGAVGSIWLYSLLQAASLVTMHVLMRRRYGLSGVKLLAFALERHRTAIIGTLIVWPPFILHFPVVQYGVDFSFRFDYNATTSS